MVKEASDEPNINLTSFDLAIRDVITRTYGCPIINLSGSPEQDFASRGRRNMQKLEPHCNILPALIAVETEASFIILFQQFITHSLHVSYQPQSLTF